MATHDDHLREGVPILISVDYGQPFADLATFSYDSTDPLAVTMVIETARWVFSRDLLRHTSGIGDVRVLKGPTYITIDLQSPNGCANIVIKRALLDSFLSESYVLVPPGTEICDIDTWLEGFRHMRQPTTVHIPMRGDLLSAAEAARLFGVTTTTITRWARADMLPCFRTLGGHRRYYRADIERIINETRESNGSKDGKA